MITSPTGMERINVQGVGPKSNDISIAQLRDAVGYAKEYPLPPSTATMSGIVTGDRISGLRSTDGLLGAKVSGGAIGPEAVVTSIPVPAVTSANQLGTVQFTVPAPAPPAPGPDLPVPAPAAAVKPSDRAPLTDPIGVDAAPGQQAEMAPAALEFTIPTRPIKMGTGISWLLLYPGGNLHEMLVTLPVNPVDGQVAYVYSARQINELTVLPAKGQCIYRTPKNPGEVAYWRDGMEMPPPDPQSLEDHGSAGWLFSASDDTWNRIR